MSDDAGVGIRFVVAVLATWRITHLLAIEDGPAGVIARLRTRLNQSFAGNLMDCFGCMSLWVAMLLPFYIAERPLDLVLIWLALSGAAFLLERASPGPLVIRTIAEPSEGEPTHGMLRSPTIHP